MSCDTAFVRIDRPAEEVFAFMAAPENMSLWSFGTWRVRIDESGLVRGTSIKDGSVIHVRVAPHAGRLLIDYHIGPSPDALVPRVFARVIPEAVFGDRDGAGLAMTVFRAAGMDDARWTGLKTAHALELDIVKSALETGYDHRTA